MGCVKNNFEHTYEQLFHKIKKTGAQSHLPPYLQICLGMLTTSIHGGLIDNDGACFIPGGNAGLLFYIKDLSTAHPEQGFL